MNFSINTYSQVISSLTRRNKMDEYPYPFIVKGDLRPEDPESVKDGVRKKFWEETVQCNMMTNLLSV